MKRQYDKNKAISRPALPFLSYKLEWLSSLQKKIHTFYTGIIGYFLFILLPITSVSADNVDKNKLTKIEAAYLYKFTKFIQWPAYRFTNSDTLNICLIGENLELLENLLLRGTKGKRSGGFLLNIKRSSNVDSISDSKSCHLAYMNTDTQGLSQHFNINNTLIINSPNYGIDETSLLSLNIIDGKLVFSINQSLLESTELEINAALLSLARENP